jgi:putative ABC transport system permease protein
LGEAFPSTNKGWGIRLESALNVYVGWVRRPLLIIQGVVALVLLIACANVAGLLLVQASGRRKEVAVRSALGAGSWPLARQFLTESFLLALLGGISGIAFAQVGLKLFLAISPTWFPRAGEIVLDIRILGFAALLSFGTALVFGAIPAVQSMRPDLLQTLNETTRTGTAAIRQQRLRGALVVLEMSVAIVLLVGAGLMLNTFLRLYSAPTGCDTRGLITFQVTLPNGEFAGKSDLVTRDPTFKISPRVPAIFEQIRERVSGLPGVESAAASIRLPLSESALGGLKINFTLPDRPANDPGKHRQSAAWFPVSAGYFHTLGIPLLRGREFVTQDTSGGLPVVLINDATAHRFWPGEDPVGKRLRIGLLGESNREIVGVVGNVRHNRYDREAQPEMYVPHVQQPLVSQSSWLESRLTMTFAIRAAGEPMRLLPALRTAVAEVNRNLPIFNVKTLDESITEQLWQPQQTLILLAIFGHRGDPCHHGSLRNDGL